MTTTPVSSVTVNSASSGGNVTDAGGAAVTARGVCWSTSANPTTSNSHTTDGAGTGTFTSSITGLTPGTTYHVRAYATNSVGTSYGNDVIFTTNAVAPTVTITAVSDITATTASSGGNVTGDGGASVTARGVCWSTSTNPTTANSHTTDGAGTGTFTSSITGLTPGTTYHVRAYATNSVGTSYGSDVTFTTNAVAPTVTTTAVSNITSTTASSGGNVTDAGGAAVTARGVCWSTSANPTTSNSHTTDGAGTGTFTSSITGLTPGTTYHVRAYATNSVGTSYGNDVIFTTNAVAPTATTTAVSNITSTTASSGGNVTDAGGAAVTARGVCWSTSTNPTTANSHTTDGAGTGTFTSSITGLTPGTTYHVRAYATNSVATSYGSDITFDTHEQTISVASPKTNDVYNIRNVISIEWTTAGIGGNLEIMLRRTDAPGDYLVKESHPYNASPLEYEVADDVLRGTYYIEIRQGDVYGRTGNFYIASESSVIRVISPQRGQAFNGGDTIPIEWTTQMIRGTVKITLIKSDLSSHYEIKTGHPYNASPLSYPIPLTVTTGSYFVKIEREQGTVSGKSAEFTITNK